MLTACTTCTPTSVVSILVAAFGVGTVVGMTGMAAAP